MAATTGKKSFLPNASVMRGSNAFENGVDLLSFRECKLAEKENAKIEKMVIEDGDGTRLWQLSERCLEMLPAQL